MASRIDCSLRRGRFTCPMPASRFCGQPSAFPPSLARSIHCRIPLRRLLAGAVAWLTLTVPLAAVTLEELEADPKMTPKRFANLFEDFDYEFFAYVQRPEVFLRTRRGDCDDYALLADRVLRQRSFTTKIVRVVLTGRRVNHVVCYVAESRAYLDYNSRKYFINLDRSGPTLREIADKVAASFEASWSSASAFSYDYATDEKKILYTVVKTDPPARDPDRQPAAVGEN